MAIRIHIYPNSKLYVKLHLQLLLNYELNSTEMPRTKVKALQLLLRKLQVLRFKLLNVFGTIQRYVFGYVYPMNLRAFEMELDRAHDVNSMIKAHGAYIATVHKSCMELKNYKSCSYGCHTVSVAFWLLVGGLLLKGSAD